MSKKETKCPYCSGDERTPAWETNKSSDPTKWTLNLYKCLATEGICFPTYDDFTTCQIYLKQKKKDKLDEIEKL